MCERGGTEGLVMVCDPAAALPPLDGWSAMQQCRVAGRCGGGYVILPMETADDALDQDRHVKGAHFLVSCRVSANDDDRAGLRTRTEDALHIGKAGARMGSMRALLHQQLFRVALPQIRSSHFTTCCGVIRRQQRRSCRGTSLAVLNKHQVR